MIILFTSIAIGIIFGILFYILLRTRQQIIPDLKTRSRLKNLETHTIKTNKKSDPQNRTSIFKENRDLSNLTSLQRSIIPIIDLIQKIFLRLAPRTIFQTIDRYIVLAGKQDSWNTNMIIFAWGTLIVGFLVFGVFFVSILTQVFWIQKVIMVILFGCFGAMIPLSFFRTKIKKRQERIVMQLPSFLDLLSISVQAGLSFDAALDRIAKRSKGPLIDEFRRMQRDLRLGLSKKDALRQMADRCDVEEVRLFTTSVIQAERLGTSMGKTLVDQADNMRDRYQQLIKTKALKAPIKMLFPLIIFIFPTIFVIVLVPTLISLINNFSKIR